MRHINPEDSSEPQFIVVAIHSEYEQTVRLFITEQAARDAYTEYVAKDNEAYISKILV